MMLVTKLSLLSRLSMNGAINLIPLYDLMAKQIYQFFKKGTHIRQVITFQMHETNCTVVIRTPDLKTESAANSWGTCMEWPITCKDKISNSV
jgi:hypothetical protein